VIRRIVQSLATFWRQQRIARAARALRVATPSDRRLSLNELRNMNMTYPPIPEYGYDPVALEARGTERAAALKRRVPLPDRSEVLEVGCWDGMVAAAFQSDEINCTGIDCRDEGFDARAVQKGVRLMKMDAARLDFTNNTFDLTFSYDAFEHFRDPAAVFREIIRVTKPGGHIYFEFGPLFMSPLGLHAYRSVRVPYCQFLFAKETMTRFVEIEGLSPIDEYCNGWPSSQFR
jgi:ubiquinone/menaquinone biosynthesis C-methylase UbiE